MYNMYWCIYIYIYVYTYIYYIYIIDSIVDSQRTSLIARAFSEAFCRWWIWRSSAHVWWWMILSRERWRTMRGMRQRISSLMRTVWRLWRGCLKFGLVDWVGLGGWFQVGVHKKTHGTWDIDMGHRIWFMVIWPIFGIQPSKDGIQT